MRKQALKIVASLSLFVLLGGACAQAQTAGGPLRAHVSFSFNVGRRTLPAGDYLISLVSRDSNLPALLIKSSDGRACVIVQMALAEAGKVAERASLIFNRYGSRYFLAQVWTPGDSVGLAVRRSRAERKVEVAGRDDAERAAVPLAVGR